METPANYNGQPGDIKTTNIRLPHSIWYAARLESLQTGESVNAMIIRLLTAYQKTTGQ